MRIPLTVDLLAKVLVVCDQNPTLVVRAADHLFIGYAGQLVEYRKCIVALSGKPLRYSRTGTFVYKKTHVLGGC